MKKMWCCFVFCFCFCFLMCGCSKGQNAISVSVLDISASTPTFCANFEFEEEYQNLYADVFLKTNTQNTKIVLTEENGKTKEVMLYEKDAYYSVSKLMGKNLEKYNNLHYLCYILQGEENAEISVCVFAGQEKTEEDGNTFLANKTLVSNQIVLKLNNK